MKRTLAFTLVLALFMMGASVFATPQGTKANTKIQVAILLDVSGSMSGLIEQAKSKLWSVVNELAKARYGGQQPTLEIALYSYGNNDNKLGIPYITQLTPLTTDLDRISEDLFALRSNGSEEYCGQVIQLSVKELEWSNSPDDLKLIFIAGNEPFTQGPIPYKDACSIAKKDHIIVNAIYCGDYKEGQESGWQTGAQMTGGKYMHIDQNEVTVHINTPYDDELIRLNDILNKTYISYGSKGAEYQARQIQQDANAASYDKSNAAVRGASKASGYYNNSHWDLVDASKEKDFDVKKVERKTLPEDMQNMSDAELNAFIAKKEQERSKISKEIRELNTRRETYVSEKRAEMGKDNTLDQALIQAVREQGEERSFLFEKF